jgi:hypothetical protein
MNGVGLSSRIDFAIGRFKDRDFILCPYFCKSLLGSTAFSYGLYCIGACLCLKKGVPITRSYVVSIPAGISLFGWYMSREDSVFVVSRNSIE